MVQALNLRAWSFETKVANIKSIIIFVNKKGLILKVKLKLF